MITVWLPIGLRHLTGGPETVKGEGSNLRELIDDLDSRYPGLKSALVENDLVRSQFVVAIGGEVYHQGLFQTLGQSKEVHIIAAVAGG